MPEQPVTIAVEVGAPDISLRFDSMQVEVAGALRIDVDAADAVSVQLVSVEAV